MIDDDNMNVYVIFFNYMITRSLKYQWFLPVLPRTTFWVDMSGSTDFKSLSWVLKCKRSTKRGQSRGIVTSLSWHVMRFLSLQTPGKRPRHLLYGVARQYISVYITIIKSFHVTPATLLLGGTPDKCERHIVYVEGFLPVLRKSRTLCWAFSTVGNKNCFLKKDCGKRLTQVKITENFAF